MKEDKFGNIVNNGKMVNIDKANVSDLEKMAEDLKSRQDNLKKKAVTVFKQ